MLRQELEPKGSEDATANSDTVCTHDRDAFTTDAKSAAALALQTLPKHLQTLP